MCGSDIVRGEIYYAVAFGTKSLHQKRPVQCFSEVRSPKHNVLRQIVQSNLLNCNSHGLQQNAAPKYFCKPELYLNLSMTQFKLLAAFCCFVFQVWTDLSRNNAHSCCRCLPAHGNGTHESIGEHAPSIGQRQCSGSSSSMPIQRKYN